MHDFLMKKLSNNDIQKELKFIGYDQSYAHKAQEKFEYHNFKIYDLSPAQANILKQTALSVGADCATHRDVITGKAEISDCILGGSIAQLTKIAQKLELQPFNLKNLAKEIKDNLNITYSDRTKLVGILNLTQNSFSDGGLYYKTDNAIKHFDELIEDGADIIDIGAESTKPYSNAISPSEQLNKILPILNYKNKNNINIPISIDTRSSQVAQECINNGVYIINDVSGLEYDSNMLSVLSNNQNIKIIIQHSKGTPENMQDNPVYENLMDDIYKFLNNKVNTVISNGFPKNNIIIDPGIGFGKTKEDNFEIIHRWKELKSIGCEIMLGLSRKSLLCMDKDSNENKDIYTLALNSVLINDKVDYIRVHNIKIHKKLLEILSK